MDTSLLSQIEAEVVRREKKREEEMTEKERCIQLILSHLDAKFDENLKHFLDQDYVCIDWWIVHKYSDFEKIAEELGFCLKMPYYYLILEIPPFANEKGKEPTIAQKKLLEYQQKLIKARTDKTNELLAECAYTTGLLRNFDFSYKNVRPTHEYSECIAHYSPPRYKFYIKVKFNHHIVSRFEKHIVSEYFSSNFNLHIHDLGDNFLGFYL